MKKVLSQTLIDNAYFEEYDFILFKENCIELLKQIPQNSIDMIFSDPPYNLSNGRFSVHANKSAA